MPLYFFYTMVQKSQKMTKNSNQGGSCLNSFSDEQKKRRKIQNYQCYKCHRVEIRGCTVGIRRSVNMAVRVTVHTEHVDGQAFCPGPAGSELANTYFRRASSLVDRETRKDVDTQSQATETSCSTANVEKVTAGKQGQHKRRCVQ